MKTTSNWWALAVVLCFVSAISFFQIDSAFADENGLNPLFWVLGVSAGLVTAFSLYKANS